MALSVSWVQIKWSSEGVRSIQSIGNTSGNTTVYKVDFGSVQAGKTTEIVCVSPRFSGMTTSVSNIKFWLESAMANNGAVNNNMDASGYAFSFKYLVLSSSSETKINLSNTFTEGQKNGTDYVYDGINRKMTTIPRSEEAAGSQQTDLSSITVLPGVDEVVDTMPYIYLSVVTPNTAASGVTDGWCYRCSFLYS